MINVEEQIKRMHDSTTEERRYVVQDMQRGQWYYVCEFDFTVEGLGEAEQYKIWLEERYSMKCRVIAEQHKTIVVVE